MLKPSTAKRKQVRFELPAEHGSQVSVAGSFNGWNPKTHPLKENPDSGLYKRTMRLPLGRHEYKYVVDGRWIEDPNCPLRVPNDKGSMNSVIDLW